MSDPLSRRDFLQRSSALLAAAGLGPSQALVAQQAPLAGVELVKPVIREVRRGGMLYRRLGQTDLFVSMLSFGSHTDPAFKRKAKHGQVLSEEGQAARDRQVARAFDLGVNMIDTYENAGQWEPVARLIKNRRDKVLVSLCRQFPMFVGENIDRAARLYGHTDLYRICIGDGPDNNSLEDWDVLRKAKQAGKVRAIGISTHSEKTMVGAVEEFEGLDFIMFPYNFIHARADYSEFLPKAIEKGIGLIAIKPLAAGSIVRLDPRAPAGSTPENERIELYGRSQPTLLPAVVQQLTKSLNRQPGESLCQAALRFVYSRPFITAAMPGMFRDAELTDNYAALERRLSRRETAMLDTASHLAKLRGPDWLPRQYRWLDERWRV